MTPIRVILDGCCLGRRKTGNETYIRGLLQGFAALADPGLDLGVLVTPGFPRPRPETVDWLEIPLGTFLTRNFLTIPRALARSGAALYHAVYWAKWWDRTPYVLMIHDLSFVSFPAGFRWHERLVFRNLIRRAAEGARQIITVSEFSKQEICGHWQIAPERVTVTYEGLESCFRPGSGLAPGEPYILCVGNLHPRKNLVRLLRAYVILRQEKRTDARLRIVGQPAWGASEIFATVRQAGLERFVEFTGYIRQEELVRQYQEAAVTVCPSLYEGFGFPVLEAMACGSPVVTSKTSSLPEIAGGAAVLADPLSVEEIATGIDQVLSSADAQQELRKRGRERAGQFRWERTAAQTLEAYRRALGTDA